jgi:hypothetical protein
MGGGQKSSVSTLVQLCGLAPWRKVLFTTYTISLSFFEAFILPCLEKVGCADVLILVDQSFYLESLSERQATSAGRGYRIVPVSMRTNGVFHPKLSYFWGESNDVCAIGSGNLTYAGQGSNLECLDILSALEDPGCFSDVSDLFSALLDSPSVFIAGERGRLATYQERAMRQSRSVSNINGTRVLHSLRQPIFTQIVERLSEFRPIKRVTCMAPFHHPAGAPVFALAKQLGAAEVDIGLDPSDLSAPFDASCLRKAGLKGRFVTLDSKDRRPLHAKWYEFKAEVSHVLTGSVNATNASLMETTNVEAAVLRRTNPGDSLKWIKKDPLSVRDGSFDRLQSVFTGYLTATLTSDNLLRGAIHGLPNMIGAWICSGVARHREWTLGTTEVSADGDFLIKIPDDFLGAREIAEAVHLRMTRGKLIIAGWISFQVDLDSTPWERGARRALDRVSRGQTMSGDILRVVHWVCSLITSGVKSAIPPSTKQSEKAALEENSSLAQRVAYSDWAASQPTGRFTQGDMNGMLRRTLAVLGKGKDALIRLTHLHSFEEMSGDDDSGISVDSAPIKEYDAIFEIVEAIDRALEHYPAMTMAVDFVKARAMLTFRPKIGKEEDRALAAVKAMEWLRWVRNLGLKPEFREQLSGFVWSVACVVQAQAVDQAADGCASELRSIVDTLTGDLPPFDPLAAATEAFRDDLYSDATPLLIGDSLASIARIQAARTVREDLMALTTSLLSGGQPTATPTLLQTIPPDTLKRLLAGGQFKVVANAQINGCPNCSCSISKGDQGDLQYRRAIVCRNCRRVLVSLGV